jgi:uncharacterized membrane protein YgdD (TMEM256/DUF423 family)
MEKVFLAAGGFFALLGVILGAFGAHAMKARLSAELLSAWQTAVQYQFLHALALLAAGLLLSRHPQQGWMAAAGILFAGGIVLFSGSLYLLALTHWRWLGPVTPLGGLAFIGGWLCFLAAIWTQK